jgi:phage shock protein C
MFCPKCGNSVDPASRFCSACGAGISSAPPPPPAGSYPVAGRLTRSRTNRVIGGVCAGMALQYGWDLTVTRILTVVLIFVTGIGPGVLAYLLAWVIIPEAPYALPAKGL